MHISKSEKNTRTLRSSTTLFVYVFMFISWGYSTSASAFLSYLDAVPNGEQFSCRTCHTGNNGGEGWNDFGKQILRQCGADPDVNLADQNVGCQNGRPVWENLCFLDADNDGQTNGEELGDPCCVWSEGDVAARLLDLSRPGDDSSQSGNPSAPGCGGINEPDPDPNANPDAGAGNNNDDNNNNNNNNNNNDNENTGREDDPAEPQPAPRIQCNEINLDTHNFLDVMIFAVLFTSLWRARLSPLSSRR